MPNIAPISELRNYRQVLEKVKPNLPVYLTKNGHGQFSVHSIEDDEDIEDDEEFEKTKVMLKLMTELNKGFQSGEHKGRLSEDDPDRYFEEQRSQMQSCEGR